MTAFFGLLKKDLHLMKFLFIVWICLFLLAMIGSFSVAKWVSEPSVVVPLFVMFASVHVFLMPIMILSVLKLEGKTQLWLYNPQSSKKLLFSKLTAAAIYQVVSLVVLGLYGISIMKFLMKHDLFRNFDEFTTYKLGFLMELGILSVAIYISLWVIFLWTIYHSLGKYPAIRNFRWLVVILVWFAYNVFEILLAKFNPFKEQFSSLTVELNILPKMDYEAHGWEIVYAETPIPIMPFILYSILVIILFLIASRLLDRKVEV